MFKPRLFRLAIGLFLSIGLSPAISHGAVDLGVPDTVYVDSVATSGSSSGYVNVFFSNDWPIDGISLTLTYDSPDVNLDSFSFIGSRVGSISSSFHWFPTTEVITITSIPIGTTSIPPGSGLLGRLHFSYNPNIANQIVRIDTITYIRDEDTEYGTVFSYQNAQTFTPQFVPGFLNIRTGACCIGDRGNINNDPDDFVDVSDVVYFVEWAFGVGPEPGCFVEANVNGDQEGSVDVADVLYLVEYTMHSGPPPPSCP